MKRIVLFMGIIMVLLCSIAQSQVAIVPQAINYQGTLTDAEGNPLATSDHKISFKIFNVSVGGAPVWGPQTFETVPVVNGQFNVILGPSDTNGISIIDSFGSADTFLEITVDDGTPIAPRQQILSAPYAISANRVRGLDVAPNGNVGIGTTLPETKLDVRGHITLETGGSPTIHTGTGGAELNRYLTLLNSPRHRSASGIKAGGILVSNEYSYANPGKSDLIVRGNVGVGTASPGAKLDVAGTAKIARWAEQSLEDNGYTKVGNLLIQWGTHSSGSDDRYNIDFPIPFPNKCFSVTTNRQKAGAESPMYAIGITRTRFSIDRENDISGTQTINWIAVGY